MIQEKGGYFIKNDGTKLEKRLLTLENILKLHPFSKVSPISIKNSLLF